MRNRPRPGPRRERVLVVASDFRAGPRAIRSLADAGYEVFGAHAAGRLAGGRSLACPRPLRHPPLLGDPAPMVEWIARTVRERRIDAVLGASEDMVRLLALNPAAVGDAVLVGPDEDQYRALCDKSLLGATAARAGVGHPRSVVVTREGADGPLPCPAVVKPCESGEAVEAEILKAVIARTPAEREEAVRQLLAAGADALVQEVVEGVRWNAHCVATADALHGFANLVLREYPRRRGITSLGASLPMPAGLREAAGNLAREVGFRGILSVQGFEHDGEFVIHDVNLRLPASIGMTIQAGLDVPRLAVDDALGHPLTGLPAAPVPTSYVCVDLEFAALWAATRGRLPGETTRSVLGETARHLRSGERRVLDPNPLDPFWLPYQAARAAVGPVRRARARRRPPAAA